MQASVERRYRLAFREFGTTVGVQVCDAAPSVWCERVDYLHNFWDERLWQVRHLPTSLCLYKQLSS